LSECEIGEKSIPFGLKLGAVRYARLLISAFGEKLHGIGGQKDIKPSKRDGAAKKGEQVKL
jgi:hypothetical protein